MSKLCSRFACLFATLLISATVAAGEAKTPTDASARARSIVERMLTGLGGADAPYRLQVIEFTFAVEADNAIRGERRHRWYPPSGDHMLRYQEKDGTTVDVAWNLHTKEGMAARAGRDLAGDELAALLDDAWRMWVNDVYWLLMPYKLLDPGVHLAWDREEVVDGRAFDLVRVTFDQVGLTPGDTYWAWIARDTGRMERWSFVLEGREPPASVFQWEDYAYYGPLLLSSRKSRVGADQAIRTFRIAVY